MEALKHIGVGKTAWPSKAYAYKILASGDVLLRVLMKHCQNIPDEKGMPAV